MLGREYKTQGTLCWVIFIPVILNTGEAEPSVSRFSSSFFPPLSLTPSWADVFAIMKSIET